MPAIGPCLRRTIAPDWAALFVLGGLALGFASCRAPLPLAPAEPNSRTLRTTGVDTLPSTDSSASKVQMASYSEPLPPSQYMPQQPVLSPDQIPPPQQIVPPPRIRDIDTMNVWPMSLDEAVRLALENSSVIRTAGGRVVAAPETTRSTSDPHLLASDPNLGIDAALAAFDTQIESGLVWNGGGQPVSSAFSAGTFGLFAQPETMAKVGLSRRLATGTEVNAGVFGGYDSRLATDFYAAYGLQLRQPLLRGAGKEFNQTAGPDGKLGAFRGVWIAQIELEQVDLDLEQAVRDLVYHVCRTYWELHFAYQNMAAKRGALQHAQQAWQREVNRVRENVSPRDYEALAKQQYATADAALQSAIGGTGRGITGVYYVEVKLRSLLGLPIDDGRLIRPANEPLTANLRFDWSESLQLAHARRTELRKQRANLRKRELEVRAAQNLRLPQVDLIGQFRRLADESDNDDPLFGSSIQGWQLGVELQRAVRNRREDANVQNANLRLRREHAVYDEQQRSVDAELRLAFTELDRTFGVTQALAAGQDAAKIVLQAEAERHAAGDTHILRVLESQNRALQAETDYQRALVDYNLALIDLHLSRGTLLESLGVATSAPPGTKHYSEP